MRRIERLIGNDEGAELIEHELQKVRLAISTLCQMLTPELQRQHVLCVLRQYAMEGLHVSCVECGGLDLIMRQCGFACCED